MPNENALAAAAAQTSEMLNENPGLASNPVVEEAVNNANAIVLEANNDIDPLTGLPKGIGGRRRHRTRRRRRQSRRQKSRQSRRQKSRRRR